MQRIYAEDGIRFLKEDGTECARIRETAADGAAEVELSGSFPGELAADLWDELAALAAGGQKITLDLKQVAYLSASAMNALLQIEKRLEARKEFLLLRHMPAGIYADFKKKGMHELFEIEVD